VVIHGLSILIAWVWSDNADLVLTIIYGMAQES
jgi:hypothetical protein